MTKASYFSLQNHIFDFHHRLLGAKATFRMGTRNARLAQEGFNVELCLQRAAHLGQSGIISHFR